MAIDYTKFSTNGQAPDQYAEKLDKRWWLVNKTERANAIADVVKEMNDLDTRRQSQYQISTRLYGNSSLMGSSSGYSSAKASSTQTAQKDKLTYNVCQATTDTVSSKIAKNKPKPLFLTSGGNSTMQRKAKKLDKFVDGIFYENKVYKLLQRIFKDACVWGDGLIHVFEHYGRIKYERVIPSELYVDYMDAFYGKPTQLHRCKNVDRQVLIELYPSKKNKIMQANSASQDQVTSTRNVADLVTVIESWHLPSGPEAKDGIHCIVIAGETLFEEDYTDNFFPFAKLSWSDRMDGWWGQGLIEQIQNIQLEINKILWVLQRSFQLAGSFKILIENGSKIVKEHLTNDIGAIINYTGTPPTYVTPPIVQPELFQQLTNLKDLAFQQAGISQLSAGSQKPAGLNSGKALREFNDIESDRFMCVGQAYEDVTLDLAKLTVSLAKKIYERDGKYEVKVPGKKFIETIDWSDIDLEEDEFVMKIFPVSSLPEDPAGRLQTVQDYMQAGVYTPRQGKRLLDFPDLEQIDTLQDAEEDYLNYVFEQMIEKDNYIPPEPFDDLQLAREMALEYYAQGKLNKLEEKKLEMIRDFIKQLDVLTAKAQPPMPTAGAPGAPQAVPQAPPQSALLPNAPKG